MVLGAVKNWNEAFELILKGKNRNKIFGIKSAIIWGHSKDTNSSFPMIYISKPKSVSQADFELLLDKIDIAIRL